MIAVIHPGTARGTAAAPPSKSMAHRLLICAALAQGESVVRCVEPSEDILATADCLRALGASVAWKDHGVTVRGCDPRRADAAALYCRESGSTLRFMLPLCLLSGKPMLLNGSRKLLSRPLTVYEDLCRSRGMILSRQDDSSILVQGVLSPGEYTIPGNISSQFVTGLLFALPLLPAPSRIRLLPPVESRSYLSLTLQALRNAGVRAEMADGLTLDIPGGAVYQPQDTAVEGDWSNAAFFEALNCAGGSVTVTGLRADSLQGDRICLEFFTRLNSGPAELDLADCPDLAPVLFSVAALCHGAVFTGTRRLRFKESDRGSAMAREMAKFGIILRMEENRISVPAGVPHPPAEPLDSHNDHRIAMSLSILCTRTGGEIRGAEAVRKSFPDYWDRLRSLGIGVQTENEPESPPSAPPPADH